MTEELDQLLRNLKLQRRTRIAIAHTDQLGLQNQGQHQTGAHRGGIRAGSPLAG